MVGEKMKQDTEVTWNWFRMNIPTIVIIASVGLYINNGLVKAEESAKEFKHKIEQIALRSDTLNNMDYRLDMSEKAIKETNVRVDTLANSMINNSELIRRDVNRLVIQVEVLSAQISLLTGVDADGKLKRPKPITGIPN